MRILLLLATLIGLAGPAMAQNRTLDAVRARGTLVCGTNPGLPGFAAPGPDGVYRGLDADTCRAVAAAVFGDAGRVAFRPVSVPDAPGMLRAGEADIVARNLSLTMSREVQQGLAGTAVNFFDTQGFLAPRSLNVVSMAQLDGKRICVPAGSTVEIAVAEAARRERIRLLAVPATGFAAIRDAYYAGACDAVAGETPGLMLIRLGAPDPAAHAMLHDVLGGEPLGPFVRAGDLHWRSLVFWTVNALIEAEALGITAANAEAMRASPSIRIRRFLGSEPGLGAPLGLAEDWAFQVIRQLGNYGEIFERNLGQGSALRLDRGLNDLYSRGGLLYPIPMR
jgi:general L-amino acid transport system substrate-binding protein